MLRLPLPQCPNDSCPNAGIKSKSALPRSGDRLRARLAGWMGLFSAFALRGGSGLPFRYAAKRRGRDMFLLLDGCCPQHWGVVACSFCFFLRWLAASARCPGVASRRHPLFFFDTGLWLLPGIWAWSPPGEGQGVRGGTPLHPLRPPYSPCPCGGGRRCRMSYTLAVARRGGRSARIFPLCGRYARLLRRSRCAGIAFAPRLAGLVGFFGGLSR